MVTKKLPKKSFVLLIFGWAFDKNYELFVYKLKSSARLWSDNAQLECMAELFSLDGLLINT